MIKEITGEQPFQLVNNGASITPSQSGYILQYSADGKTYTSYEDAVPANETLIITGLPILPLYFRLSGNTSTVKVSY